MASGHDPTFYAVVMNIVILALTIIIISGDRSGYANGAFSTTKLGDMSLSVRVGPSVYEYIVSLYIPNRSFLEQAKDGIKVR